MTHVIRFGEPPAAKPLQGRPPKYADLIEELKARPNTWALINDNAPNRSLTTYLKNRYPLEAVARTNDTTGNLEVWARYTDKAAELHEMRRNK